MWPDNRGMAYQGACAPMLLHDELEAPGKRKKPARIVTQFMGDLGFESATDVENFSEVWSVMRNCPWHTFLVLTKRPKRFKELWEIEGDVLPNVQIGVSAEDQPRADERIPILLQIPAAVHWVSVEPMLGPMDLNAIPFGIIHKTPGKPEPNRISALRNLTHFFDEGCVDTHGLEWVVAGPETGPGARRCDWQWIEDLHEQCKAAGVAFYDKRNVSPLAREYPE
jgi:protein gp37